MSIDDMLKKDHPTIEHALPLYIDMDIDIDIICLY